LDGPVPAQVAQDVSQAVHVNVVEELVLKVFDAHVQTPLLALKPPGHVLHLEGPVPVQVVQDGSQVIGMEAQAPFFALEPSGHVVQLDEPAPVQVAQDVSQRPQNTISSPYSSTPMYE
jgi:hypothetical protein